RVSLLGMEHERVAEGVPTVPFGESGGVELHEAGASFGRKRVREIPVALIPREVVRETSGVGLEGREAHPSRTILRRR
ncbi:hypothetical protein, partial [Corallococcus terminator]|uniref:hypothetical protein n=1 Tax=Corallococcus terminator TaxID=2316733 RepID=UPI001ABF408C